MRPVGCRRLPTGKRSEQAAGRIKSSRAALVTRAESLEVMRLTASFRFVACSERLPRGIEFWAELKEFAAGIQPGAITL